MKRPFSIVIVVLSMVALVAGCQSPVEKTQEPPQPSQTVVIAEPSHTAGAQEQPQATTASGPLTLEITSPKEGKETTWGFTRVGGTVSPTSAAVSIENEGYANVAEDGSFESDYILLDEGTNKISVTASAGNEEITRTVTVYYTLELHVSISLDLGPGRDWYTESPARIGGRVSDPHAEVNINGQTAEVDNGGHILVMIELEEGTNTITAFARLGDQTASDTREAIYVPLVPLVIEINAPDNGFSSKLDLVKIAGTVSNPGARVTVSNKSAAFPPVPARVTASGAFYAYVSLEKGDNQIEVDALRGSDYASAIIDIGYHPPLINLAHGPDLKIDSPQNNGEYRINVLPVTGTVDNPHATILVNGTEAIVAADGSFRGCAVLNETGENTIKITAFNDKAKTVRSINVTFVPPLVIYLDADPEPGVDYTKELLPVTGTVNKPEASVTVNGEVVPVNEDGIFKAQVLLNEGSNRILAVATLGNERDEAYIMYFIENGVLGHVPGYSHFFDAILHYEHEITLKAGETLWLPVTLETRKDGPGSFSDSFVYVDREYGLMPLPWLEGLDVYLEPPEFTAYPNATYNFYLVVKAVPELESGTYYLHFYYIFETGFYGNGWIEIVVE